jgi:putative flippase GtrA
MTEIVSWQANRAGFFSQAFRFGLVEICGAIVDYGSLRLILALEVWPELARVFSFIIGRQLRFSPVREFRSRRSASRRRRRVALCASQNL